MTLYYEADGIRLYHGDCLELDAWLDADVLITDPPYGRDWHMGSGMTNANGKGRGSKAHEGIANDRNTVVRDDVIARWRGKPGIVFGDPLIRPPVGAVQALIYAKPLDAGIKGAHAGFRRDIEMIYLTGSWPVGVGGNTSILHTGGLVAGPRGIATRAGHPHAKPIDLLERLLSVAPVGLVADPFAGSGSTLIAARNLGRTAVGVEVDERFCEVAASRLSQGALDFGDAS